MTLLVNGLSDPDFKVREKAAHDLLDIGRHRPDEVLPMLKTHHKDPETAERCARLVLSIVAESFEGDIASITNNHLAFKDVLAVFHEIVSDGQFSRVTGKPWDGSDRMLSAMTDLVQLWDKDSIGAQVSFDALLRVKDGDFVCLVLRCLESISLRDDRVGNLASRSVFLLRHPDPDVRCTACEVMGVYNVSASISELARCAADSESCVRASAILALGKIGDPSSLEVILKSVSDRATVVKLAVLDALPRFRDSSSVTCLYPALEDPDPEVRIRAIRAVGGIGNKRAISKIVKYLDDPDANARGAAVWAIGILGEQFWRPDPRLTDSAREWWVAHKHDPVYAAQPYVPSPDCP